METVMITGGTGLIGRAVAQALIAKDYHVTILTRSKKDKKSIPNVGYAEWDVTAQAIDPAAIRQADYIIHLAGANVADGRWTSKRKKEIVDSRVQSGKLLVKALKEIPNKVKAVISASAIGYYGPDPSIPNPRPFTETDPPANDFLGTTVQQWENSLQSLMTDLNKRLVILRTGIVLSKKGGAYKEFEKPMKFGMATVLGSGKQVVSWIHIDDLVRLYITALEDPAFNGTYNAVAQGPVSNKELIREMKRQSGKPLIMVTVPAVALKIALGEMSIEVLKSTTVSSARVEGNGFKFEYPDIVKAINNLKKS